MSTGRLALAVPFPEWAPDHWLRFTTRDICELANFVIGVDPASSRAKLTVEERHELIVRRLNKSWLQLAEKLLDQQDVTFIREAIRAGLKRPGAIEHVKPSEAELDDLPFAPGAVVQKIADGLVSAVTGKSYAAIVQDREAFSATAPLGAAAGSDGQ